MTKGKLYLIPTVIADDTQQAVITEQVRATILKLDYFLVENIRTTRRYFSSLKLGLKIEDLSFETLDKKTNEEEILKLMAPVMNGKNVGVLSESGCPGIADPGSLAVEFAHQNKIQVMPLSGPSSIFMALMASGFSGQSFVFHGYLPIDKKDRMRSIQSMEQAALKLQQTQIFMDTPYRNQKLFEDLIKTCNGKTKVSIARGISGAEEFIRTLTIAEWRNNVPDLGKIPTVFSLFV